MANNLTSNITSYIIPMFMEAFRANRVITKTINRQIFAGKFTPARGTTVKVKRPHDYVTSRTSDGDLTSETKSSILSGSAVATVQNYFTAATEWSGLEQCTQLDQLREILAPMATRIITDLETDLCSYMLKNCGLAYGTPGTAIDAWTDVAGASAHMENIGVPHDKPWYYVMNPQVAATLAALQTALSPAQATLVETAWSRAMLSNNVGGFQVMRSNALASRTNTTAADLAGTLSAAPTLTYVGAKDTMTQSWAVAGFTASATIKAGSVIQVTGKYYCSQSTRGAIFAADGSQVLFRAIVTADVTLSSAGAGTIVVAGAGIYESGGQYNTMTAALAQSDVITILGTSGVVYQPALFYHADAFALATVEQDKLPGWDSSVVNEDGISIRVTRYSDGDKNKSMIRFDLLPAYATLNPFWAGQGYGV